MRPQERFVGALQPSVHAVRQGRRGACVRDRTPVGNAFVCLKHLEKFFLPVLRGDEENAGDV